MNYYDNQGYGGPPGYDQQNQQLTPYYYSQPGYAPNAPEQPDRKKKRKRKVLPTIALVLACALSGFGGGYAAISLLGGAGEQTVVYRSAEQPADASGVSTADTGTVSEVAAKALPSVVSISTENLVTDYFTGGRVVSGAGSGVILSEDGTIVTNNHVVEGARNIQVTLQDGSVYNASLVATDPATDIAVLKISATGLVPAVLGDSDALQVGEFCIAIGNPMGTLGGTVTDGIISALNRELQIDNTPMNLLQMSAAVSPGNSGGGLFNSKGELIGIVNAKSRDSNAEGLGFAIPVNTAMPVVEQLLANGYVPDRPGLGVTVATFASPAEASFAGYGEEAGLYISEVQAGSAAEKAGLLAGDRVVSADGVAVQSAADLTKMLGEKKVGDTLALEIVRAGAQQSINVVLQEIVN